MAINIHPTSFVSSRAKLGTDVKIGPFCIIHDNVIIGDRTEVCSYSELGLKTPLGDGSPLTIGSDSYIRSHAIFYESSFFGNNLTTGHNVIVREMTKTGIYFQIGTKSELQGHAVIGDYVRFQSNVFVSKFTTIGNFVWVLPNVIFANDPTPPSDNLIGSRIEDYACICAGATVLPGITVGTHSVVAASACVTKDVPSGFVAVGNPAKSVKHANKILRRDGSSMPAYPWTAHFDRGYPITVVKSWRENG